MEHCTECGRQLPRYMEGLCLACQDKDRDLRIDEIVRKISEKKDIYERISNIEKFIMKKYGIKTLCDKEDVDVLC